MGPISLLLVMLIVCLVDLPRCRPAGSGELQEVERHQPRWVWHSHPQSAYWPKPGSADPSDAWWVCPTTAMKLLHTKQSNNRHQVFEMTSMGNSSTRCTSHHNAVESAAELSRSLPTSVPESPRAHQPRTPRTPRTPGRQDPNKTPRFYPVMKESSTVDGQVSSPAALSRRHLRGLFWWGDSENSDNDVKNWFHSWLYRLSNSLNEWLILNMATCFTPLSAENIFFKCVRHKILN